MKNCPDEDDNRRRVCSNYNETWSSDCEVYRQRCLCDEFSDDCTDQMNKHLHIDYYGECREMPVSYLHIPILLVFQKVIFRKTYSCNLM